MPPHIFSLWGCWGCYDYLNRYLPGMKVPVNFNCRVENYKIPCHNDTMYFDRHDEIMVNAIAATLRSEWDEGKWLRCCEAADMCCERIKLPPQSVSNETCIALWDGSKHCYAENITWNVFTDYMTCSHAPRLRLRHHLHVYMLGTAIVLTLPAVIIFIVYKRLRNITRIILHRNLLLAIIIRN
ncbi:hypothetical protein B566_EDAN004372, partial [Ephemera danica]